MKFGHEFQQHLQHDGFPAHWVDAAIQYRQLKKCIKRVQRELAAIGLDAETLGQLLQHTWDCPVTQLPADNPGTNSTPRPFRYSLSPALQPVAAAGDATSPFLPKLLFAVDTTTGRPVDACLTPETREYLQKLALNQHKLQTDQLQGQTKNSDGVLTDEASSRNSCDDDSISVGSASTSASTSTSNHHDATPPGASSPPEEPPLITSATTLDDLHNDANPIRLIEVPLTADSEFFTMLQTELSGLATLQRTEQARLTAMVGELAQAVVKVTEPSRAVAKHDLEQWRAIFELYLQSDIFFSTTEQDRHSAQSASKAAAHLEQFTKQLRAQAALTKFRRKESTVALTRFLEMNVELLQCLQFQEMNHKAMTKILKKFDKRTALGVQNHFPTAMQTLVVLPSDVAKAVCAKVQTELLPVVPQLDDYLCPVCFTIAYRPVRLRCQHVFCIRCLIKLQRAKENHCPLCRGQVVMEADSTCLDPALTNFLKKYFPHEVKEKQKENERAAAIDQYGEAYDSQCTVM